MNTIHYGNANNEQRTFIEARIEQEIYCLANAEVNFILSSESMDAPYSWDDLTMSDRYEYNGEFVPFYDISYDDLQAEIELLQAKMDQALESNSSDEIEREINELQELQPIENDILQWFYCSEWLATKLSEIGESVIIRSSSPSIWGRTCCGQGIALDPTFWDIFQEDIQEIKG